MLKRIISASLSPNTEAEDVFAAVKMMCTPWHWRKSAYVDKISHWFANSYPGYETYTINSGRSALFLLLKSFGISNGDSVMVQSFTCVAVPNAVLWAGAMPVYVDIDESLNIDIQDAQKKLSKNVKAIIVQHTLGLSADMDKLSAFAKKNNLLLIEDCAHALGGSWKNKPLGSFGDASFFSFGRDKILSSVFGGVAIIRKSNQSPVMEFTKNCLNLPKPSLFWIFQQLLHPIIFSIVLPLYTSGFGKGILWVFQKLGLLSFPVFPEEKHGARPEIFPSSYPNALAYLLTYQLRKITRYNDTRKNIASYYIQKLSSRSDITFCGYPKGSIFLRFPILVKSPEAYMRDAKKQGILLGNWYHNTIDPSGVDFSAIGYIKGCCPNAEKVAKNIINLPTNITIEQAERVIAVLH